MSYIPVLSFTGTVQQDETWISQSYKLPDTYLSCSISLQSYADLRGELQIYVSNDDSTYVILNSLSIETGGPKIDTLLTNVTGFYMQVRYANTGATQAINLTTKLRDSYVI